MPAIPSLVGAETRAASLQYDGADRVPFLSLARLITLAPSAAEDQPVDVAIVWEAGRIEFPLPGSSLWRAALTRWLERPATATIEDRVIRDQVRHSLERFPSLERWWEWISSGWTSPAMLEPPYRARPESIGVTQRWPW